MRHYFLIITFVIIIQGCVSMPTAISDAHLVEKTPEESAKLEKIEQSIIVKKNENDDAKKTLKIAEQKQSVIKGNIKILEKKHEVLIDEKKLYEISKDGDKLGDTREKLEENNKETKKEKGDLKYNTVFIENAKAIVEVKKAELAMLVAKLSYEKAKIANKFLVNQKKMEEKEAGVVNNKEEESFMDGLKRTVSGAGDGTIDEEKYNEYLKKQQDTVKEKKAEQKKTDEKLAAVKKELEGPEKGGKKKDEKK